jgi:hypothetical protein
MSKNIQPFREDVSANRSSGNVDMNIVSSPILTEKSDNDSPDKFIKKMENTMSKKRKNNYKNIEELENIYDTNNKPKKSTSSSTEYDIHNYKPGDLSEAFDELEQSMKSALSPFITSSKGKKNDGKKKKKLEEEDINEGFRNKYADGYKRIYKSEYEYDKPRRRIGPKRFNRMKKNAKAGLLNTKKLDELLNTGQISQWQYNELFGLFLNFGGFDWKNQDITPKETKRCPKWNKDCGSGPNILDYIKALINKFKQLLGIYLKILRYISTLLYKSTDGKLDGTPSNTSSDVSIIVNILHYLIMIPLSMHFAYNWFYITFYRDSTEQLTKIDFAQNVMKSLKGLLMRFFKCLVKPMILLDSLLRMIIPKSYYAIGKILTQLIIGPFNFSLVGKIMTNQLFVFISLTLIILGMSSAYSDTILNMLISYMENAKVPYASYLHCIIAYDWIIGVADVGIIDQIIEKLSFLIAPSPLSSLFWFLILVIFSHLIIRFAGVFIILYLYAMSYLALSIYFPGGRKIGVETINLALEKSVSYTDNKCPRSKWEKIILNLLHLVYKYLVAVLYVIVLLYSTYLILAKMKSSSSKIILGSTLVMIIAIIVMAVVFISMNADQGINKSDIDV